MELPSQINPEKIAVSVIGGIGRNITYAISEIGSYINFVRYTIREAFRPPIRINLIFQHMEFIGNQSLNIIMMSGFFVGAVFGLQIGIVFKIFKAEGIMGAATGKALARELAPMMTGFLLAGRAGSAMTAEIATMKVNEQVDAMEAMGVDPIHYLVVPRLIASVLIVPILSGVFVFVGVLGAYAVGVLLFDVDQGAFFDKINNVVEPKDVWSGLQKALIFAVIIATLACKFGLKAGGGAKGVGMATTNSVVVTFLTLLAFDFFITFIQIVF